MNLEELETFLLKFNDEELYYRESYHNKPFVDSDALHFQKWGANSLREEDQIDYLTEDYIFNVKQNFNVITVKHTRYIPVFQHKHAFFEMIFAYSGSIRQYISGNEVVLNEGDLCIIPPEVHHSIHVFDDSVAINILIRKSTFHDTFFELMKDDNVLSSFFNKILYARNYNSYIIFRNNHDKKVKDLLSNIILEDIENKKYANKILDNLLMAFFGYLLRDHEDKVELPTESSKNIDQLASIISYMQNHFRTVTLSELSNRFHFTVPYLSKIIKESTGQTFIEIIKAIKMNKAIELLTQSNMKVQDISQAIGYENNTHFIRTFKCTYGMSPSKYRKAYQVPLR